MADWLSGMKVGDWYLAGDGSQPEPFELVAIDIKNESVLVQHFDGTLEEYDFDSWMELGAQPAAPPEDWSGAMDMDRADAGYSDDFGGERWDDPLDFIDQQHL